MMIDSLTKKKLCAFFTAYKFKPQKFVFFELIRDPELLIVNY